MRYFVRDREGQELIVPSLPDLHALYQQGFLSDDDLVRAETAERWVRAGTMPALRGVRLRRADPRKLWTLAFAGVALAAALALLLSR
jgi:hypothetical protein